MKFTMITEKKFTLKVIEPGNNVVSEHFYSSDFIAELLNKIIKLRTEYKDDIDIELIDVQTGEILFYQKILEKDVLYKQGGPLVDLANLL